MILPSVELVHAEADDAGGENPHNVTHFFLKDIFNKVH
jgi:hypothetical protein